jgi:hypothetical protein
MTTLLHAYSPRFDTSNASQTPRARAKHQTALMLLLTMASLALARTSTQAQSTATFFPAADSGVKIENVLVNNAASPVSVTTGNAVAIDLDYTIIDARCPGCIDQIQYGWVNTATGAGMPVLGQCIYNGVPGPNGARGHAKLTLTAPREAGSYALAFDRAQAFRCSDVTGWWNGTPRPVQRIATIQVKSASTDPLGSITGLPLHQIGAGVRAATIATTSLGRYVQLRYSLPGQPFDTERDFVDGPAGWGNIYGTGRPFFNVSDGQRFGVIWQARNTMTVYVTWFGADPAAYESFILPTPTDAILAAATGDGTGNLYAFSIQSGDGRPNTTRVGTLLKTNTRGAELARSRPDMSAAGLNVTMFGDSNSTWVADMQFSNGALGLVFSRLMHASSDGLNHQGGVAAVFDAQSLALTKNHGQTSGHSFDNVLTRDAQGNFLGIDLGDNYPRGLNLHRFNATSRASRVVYTFKTEHGRSATSPAGATYPKFDEISDAQNTFYRWSNDNRTYTELGGAIDTSQGIIAVFAGERPSLDNRRTGATLNDPRNLGMLTVKRDFAAAPMSSVVPDDLIVSPGNPEEGYYYTFGGAKTSQRNTGVRWLTNYTSTAENASRVKLHPLTTTDALILWELWDANTYQNTLAMSVRADGTITQQPVALGSTFRLNRRDDLFDRAGHIYAIAGDGANRELILNVLVRGQ